MVASVIARFSLSMRKIDLLIDNALRQFHPGLFGGPGLGLPLYGQAGEYPGINLNNSRPIRSSPQPSCHVENFLKNAILWAAPRNRRTIERRLKRKFGYEEQVYKLMLPKTNLLICNSCGHSHESGILCSQCYKKVCGETEVIQKAVQAELGLSPVDKEVVVLYDGEKNNQPEEFWKGKRIVEMKKPRPQWFGKNLLQQSTAAVSYSNSDVKPTDLA